MTIKECEIEACVEYQTDTIVGVSFTDPDLGLVTMDLEKSIGLPPDLKVIDTIRLKRLVDKGEETYVFISLKPNSVLDLLAEARSVMPPQPGDWDDPEQVKTYMDKLGSVFKGG